MSVLSCAMFVTLMAVVLSQEPKRCCLPSTWKAHMTNISSINSDALDLAVVFYNYNIKMTAQQYMSFKPGSKPVRTKRVVMDYNKGKSYVIQPSGDCFSIPNPIKMFPPCGTDNMTVLYTSYVGPEEGGTPCTALRLQHQSLTVTIAMDTQSCVPIIEGVTGQVDSIAVNSERFFSGFTTPFVDKSVFTVPPSC